MTRGVFLSVGLTAAAQAVLGFIGFLVVGVPRAGTLSALMFFLALVPGGVALVWAPVAIWLAARRDTRGAPCSWWSGAAASSARATTSCARCSRDAA